MRHPKIQSAAFILIAAFLTTTAASAQQLLPAGPSDLTAGTLLAAQRLKGQAVSRDAVAVSWPLEETAALAAPEPFVSHSREYFVDVTADDLRQGVPVYTTRPGALVRLNPATGPEAVGLAAKAGIVPASLVLRDPAGRSHGGGSGMDLMAGAAELKASRAPFAEGTSAFRIREDLGAGAFELRAEGLADDSGRRYVMHVFDRSSPIELELRTTATEYLHGQSVTVEAALADGDKKLPARRLDGFVTSPAGRAWPLTFRNASGVYRATLELDALEAPAPGLWQVHASVQARHGGHAVLRAGRTAFACAVPSARLTGELEIASAEGIALRLGVEAATAGRYEARGVLYATAADGSLRPAGIAHSAAWLEAGAGSLELAFDREILAGKSLAAPFEVRDLRLIDQVSMGLLHRQERALAF